MSQDIGGAEVKEGGIELLTELLAATAGTGAKLHLYKAAFSPTRDSVEADFETNECDFGGYSATALTFGSVGLDGDGQAVVHSTRVVQQVTGPIVVNPNTVGGAWLEDVIAVGPPKNSKVLRYFPFPTPVPMSAAGAQMSLEVVLNSLGAGKLILDT